MEGTKIWEELSKPCFDDIVQSPHNIVELQRQDKSLKRRFEKAISQSPQTLLSQKEWYVVKNDRLYWQGAEGERLVVSMTEQVLQLSHSVPWVGHLEKQKHWLELLADFIGQDFTWMW